MPPSRLSPLQVRVLRALAGADGDWTLTGGAALPGFHTRHRATRDLDLFWRSRSELSGVREQATLLLTAEGLSAVVISSAPALVRLRVAEGGESVIVDLVADPVAAIEQPTQVEIGGRPLRIDSPHEILVNELCALLQRPELRDLLDVEALLAGGGDLERALRDSPRKDSGFSPLTLIWILRQMPIEAMARANGATEVEAARLTAVRDELIRRVAALARP